MKARLLKKAAVGHKPGGAFDFCAVLGISLGGPGSFCQFLNALGKLADLYLQLG